MLITTFSINNMKLLLLLLLLKMICFWILYRQFRINAPIFEGYLCIED